MENSINIEVVYATNSMQHIIPIQIKKNSTIKQAIDATTLNIDLENHAVGIFGKLRSLDHVLENSDRVEIYTPLLIDPKSARSERVQHERKLQRLQRLQRQRKKAKSRDS